MTVAEMQARVSNQEFVQWEAFYAYRNHMQEKEMEKAKRG